MCGIAAIFAYRSPSGHVRASELDAMASRMLPRGPDDHGRWISPDGRVGLTSRRLAIVDLSADGAQPMWDSAGEVAVVFNGEIYNHVELRASLQRLGVKCRSRSDTEVLLHLYRLEGEAMLGRLRGMYAFVVWDSRVRRLFVARDPYGIKPLYFADDGHTVRLASTVKALVAGGAVSGTSDPAGVVGYFLTGSVPEPFTIRKDIRSVEAGTAFHVEDGRGRHKAVRHYSIAEVFRRAESQLAFAHLTRPEIFLRERVEESVAHHLVADVPVGVFLSAGIDSSSLAAIAARLSSEPVHTFTLSFEEFRGHAGDEAPVAERFARILSTRHTTRMVARGEFDADLPRIIDAMDQPTIDGVNTWFVSKAVREAGLKVALSGVGGDELFGSYPSFRNVPRLVQLTRLPLVSRAARLVSRHPKAAHVDQWGRTYAGAYLLQRGLFLPEELPAIVGADTATEGLDRLSMLELIDATISTGPAMPYGRVATLEASLYMRNQLLRDADWASMAHSVEVRTPLVDAAMLRQVAPLLLDAGRICKSAMASSLPSWLRGRPKSGFSVPMREWMRLPADGTRTRMRSWARFVFQRYVHESGMTPAA